ncbi:hypothetical protein C2S52_003801 [Perilla frutescens var. hirtella]|nr:hypothetical protein C2S52_003801 [Perilla frutescens var. hirtella]
MRRRRGKRARAQGGRIEKRIPTSSHPRKLSLVEGLCFDDGPRRGIRLQAIRGS